MLFCVAVVIIRGYGPFSPYTEVLMPIRGWWHFSQINWLKTISGVPGPNQQNFIHFGPKVWSLFLDIHKYLQTKIYNKYPLLFIVDIEVDGSHAKSDIRHTEELSLTLSVLGCFSVLSYFNIKVKSLVGNIALPILLTDWLTINSSRRYIV